MFLTYLILAVALSLSAVAAFYSIIGLTAIFAAAVIPVAIMGTVLEVAKLVVTVWLHDNWARVKLLMKLYLVPAVLALMFITSMGIFGFLSRAHIEQTAIGVESQAQIERLETEIARRTSAIDQAETRLTKIQTTGLGSDTNTQAQIDAEQARIDSAYNRIQPAIEEQNQIIAAQTQLYAEQIEKIDSVTELLQSYIDAGEIAKAQSLVGTRADGQWGPATAQAVRSWQERKSNEKQALVDELRNINENNSTVAAARQEIQRLRKSAEAQVSDSTQLINRLRERIGQTSLDEIDAAVTEQQEIIRTATNDIDQLTEQKYALEVEYRKLEAEVGPIKYIAEFVYGEQADKNMLEHAVRWVIIILVAVFDPLAVMMLLAFTESRSWHQRPFTPPTAPASPINDVIRRRNNKNFLRNKTSDITPEDTHQTATRNNTKVEDTDMEMSEDQQHELTDEANAQTLDDTVTEPEFSFGSTMPVEPKKGTTFVKTDQIPSKMFKFNGDKWIRVDKASVAAYNEYIDFLAEKVKNGEYDIDLLTETELKEVEERLKKDVE